jgi:hypothetical protein
MKGLLLVLRAVLIGDNASADGLDSEKTVIGPAAGFLRALRNTQLFPICVI